MRGLSARFALAALLGAIACSGQAADASVIVGFSGTFGSYPWSGPKPSPLDNGSFSGSAELPSLPSTNTQSIGGSVFVQFKDSSNNVLFTLSNATASYDVLSANSTDYNQLTISGNATGVGGTANVAPLSLGFIWPIGTPSGTVFPSDTQSYIEYTVAGTTYFAPVLAGQAAVAPEPSTIGLSLIGVAAFGLNHWRKRRKAAA